MKSKTRDVMVPLKEQELLDIQKVGKPNKMNRDPIAINIDQSGGLAKVDACRKTKTYYSTRCSKTIKHTVCFERILLQ